MKAKVFLTLAVAAALAAGMFTLPAAALPREGMAAAASDQTGDFDIENGVLVSYNGTGGDIVIPVNATSIGAQAFEGTSITSVSIPNSVTEIGKDAFLDCSSLKTITVDSSNADFASDSGVLFNKAKTRLLLYPIGNTRKTYAVPQNVTSIAGSAFNGCSVITNVSIPAGVTSIGDGAFGLCENLGSITVDPANGSYVSANGILFNKDKTTLIQYPGGDTQSTYVIPGTVTLIDSYAFSGCADLTSVSIPNTVSDIRDHAFADCTGLAGVVLPNNLTGLGDYAFSGCSALASVTLSAGLGSLGDGVFDGCALTSFDIPAGVTAVGNSTFADCAELGEITIPAGVTSLGDEAFRGTALTTVTVPASVTSVGEGTFQSCTRLSSADLSSGLTNIGDCAFSGTDLSSVTIPKTVSTLGQGVFEDCGSLEKLSVASGNTYYATDNGVLFSNDQNTLIQYPDGNADTSYVIPAGTETVSDSAFCGAGNLNTISIPDGLTTIGGNAFEGTMISSVNIPSSVTEIDDGVFSQCSNLSDITVDAANADYSSLDGVLFDKGQTVLMQYPCGSSQDSYTIPDGVSAIGNGSFDGIIDLTTLTIPDSVKTIDSSAFGSCDNLTIDCASGSYAETYAQQFGISYSITSNPSKTLSSIQMSALPYKMLYGRGQPIDLTGAKVKANYADGTSEAIDVTPSMISGFDSDTSGTKNVTVTLSGMTTTFSVTVDTTPPTIKLNITGANYTTGRVTATITDANFKSAAATLNSQPITWPANDTFTAYGFYVVTATDKAGNTSTARFSIDKSTPTLSATQVNAAKTVVKNGSYVNTYVLLTVTNAASKNISKNGKTAGWPQSGVVKSDGTYVVTLTDNYGSTGTFTFTIDSSK